MRDGSQSDPIMGQATHRKSGCAGRVAFRAPSRPAYGPCGGQALRRLAQPRATPAPAPPPESFSKIALASWSEFPYSTYSHGGVAQLGERLTGSQEVRGSIPLVSTIVNAKVFEIPKAFFHAKTPHATNTNHANKQLHNLFPMSVHSLLDKRDYQCRSPFHLGFRNAPNHRHYLNNLHQCEQHRKTAPLNTLNERYVVHHKLNQFRYQLVLGYLTLHEFNCARGPASRKTQGRSASGRNGGARNTTSSNKEVMRLW